ncbi:alpha/beta fold hydrolase [Pseudonocardia sp. EV170527-09]|uniref:alpha/beta fold hydrolase n=1 Tax=Pseudonocardia sp. EV170527-09 TaxID=2603411 RepID=UPI0011F2194A|nr:alpha/beta hydrolase [Pseudonocardia sp. EV170527-09]KAA1025489.1 alpha/beta fold hydrolase [Pseudonocardia sp. EV170527-09]
MPLHHEVTGSGPPLLLIQGGASEAGAARMLVDELAVTHRVLTYDRRGIGRSPADDDVPVPLTAHADDAAGLLAGTGPAAVVGVSIGAVIGLLLAVRHPGLVTTLVAHEPPLPGLVRDAAFEAAMDRVEDLVARDDIGAAIRTMAALTSGDDPVEPGYRPEPPSGDPQPALRRFLRHDVPAVRAARIDPADVTASGVRVIPTGGYESRGRWEHRCAEALAAGIGRGLVELPGGHDGPVTHPVAAAAALRGLVGGT